MESTVAAAARVRNATVAAFDSVQLGPCCGSMLRRIRYDLKIALPRHVRATIVLSSLARAILPRLSLRDTTTVSLSAAAATTALGRLHPSRTHRTVAPGDDYCYYYHYYFPSRSLLFRRICEKTPSDRA